MTPTLHLLLRFLFAFSNWFAGEVYRCAMVKARTMDGRQMGVRERAFGLTPRLTTPSMRFLLRSIFAFRIHAAP